MSTAVYGTSRVTLHDLHAHADRDEWVVGRVDSGEFVAVPEIAVDVLQLLRDGLTVDEVRRRLQTDRARDVDVAGFVERLAELGFVAAIGGRRVSAAPPAPETLPWLRARWVRWIVTWPVAAATIMLVASAALVLSARPDLIPVYRDLFWSTHTSVVVVGNAVIVWSVILLHELAHLTSARAYGVPGRMSLSTRLQFLAVQTDVSGIWARPRTARLVVYLSGVVVNLVVAATALLARVATGPDSAIGGFAAAVVILALLPVPLQLLVFMRTDVYFVVQDLAGCRNLYGDGAAYVRWWARRLVRPLGRGRSSASDPSAALPRRERRAVRAYTVLLAVGTATCLSVAAVVTVPFAVALIVATAERLVGVDGAVARVDGVITAGMGAGFWALWTRAWWRRHGPRVRTWLGTRRSGADSSKPERR